MPMQIAIPAPNAAAFVRNLASPPTIEPGRESGVRDISGKYYGIILAGAARHRNLMETLKRWYPMPRAHADCVRRSLTRGRSQGNLRHLPIVQVLLESLEATYSTEGRIDG
jgi:hypothetical protein